MRVNNIPHEIIVESIVEFLKEYFKPECVNFEMKKYWIANEQPIVSLLNLYSSHFYYVSTCDLICTIVTDKTLRSVKKVAKLYGRIKYLV